jgi:predicted transcriptional regulator of viral defense system
MENLKKLPNSPLTLKELMQQYGVTGYRAKKLIEVGELEKLGHGVYQKVTTGKDEQFSTDAFKNAYVRAKKESYICLWSALSFYDITLEIPKQVWIAMPYDCNVQSKGIRSVRKRKNDWSLGIDEFEGFRISSIERTIIDCFLSPKNISPKQTLEIVKEAMREEKVGFSNLVRMARDLDVMNRVRFYLELLS